MTAVVVVLREENYETRFGDGYYAYLDSAFLTRADAEAYRAAKAAAPLPHDNNTGWTWHVREGTLTCAPDGTWHFEASLREGESVDARQVAAILGLAP